MGTSTFTQSIADTICERLTNGESLRSICESSDMPAASTVFKWLNDVPGFSEQYAHAREAQAEHLAEEILAIADDGANDTYVDGEGNTRTDQEVIGRSKLRVDARKWLASKMAPKKYGDKQHLEMSGSLELRKMSDAEIDEELAQLAAVAAAGAAQTDSEDDASDLL